MGYLQSFLDHVAESFAGLFHLDPDPALSERENVLKVIEQTATVAAIVSVALPIPAGDFLVLTPIQAKMTLHIGKIKGFQVNQERAQEIVTEVLGVLGMTLTANLLIVSVSKLIPVVGGMLASPLVYAATWAIGQVVDYYFDCLREGTKPSGEVMKDLFSEQFRVGKARGQELDKSELERQAEELRQKVEARDAELRTETRLTPGGEERRPRVRITIPPKGEEAPPPEAAPPPRARKTIGPEPEAPAVAAAPAASAPAASAPAADGPGLVDQLERLARLRHAGVLSEEEFERAKRRLLEGR